MAVTTQDKRDEKLEWLTRPIDWAYTVSACVGGVCILGWYNGDLSTQSMLYLAVPALFISAGLSYWAMWRIRRVANRR